MPHLALVAKAQQSLLEDLSSTATTATATSPSSNTIHESSCTSSRNNNNNDNSSSCDDDLTAIYESYASLYPNPRLMLEVRERHMLLTAASAAQEAERRNPAITALPKQKQPKQQQKQRQRGFLGRLFGSGSKDDAAAAAAAKVPAAAATMSLQDAVIMDDDRLEFGDFITTTDNDDDYNMSTTTDDDTFPLCGTLHAVDDACIPMEAHALARFHLASTSRGGYYYCNNNNNNHPGRPNVAKNAWERPGSTLLVITGLGQFVEFPYSSSNHTSSSISSSATATGAAAAGGTSGGGGIIQYTSDAEDLKDYCTAHYCNFQVAYARAAMIGPNLVVVSWGLTDGTVVFYRRLAVAVPVPTTKTTTTTKDHGRGAAAAASGGDGGVITWEAVACSQPTPVVQHNLGDVFAEEQQDAGGGRGGVAGGHAATANNSALLIATDVLPIVVELGKDDIPAATVAISRLGGFIELVPLPPRMWYGDTLELVAATSASAKKQQQWRQQRAARRQKLQQTGGTGIPHYAAKLVNVAMMPAASSNTSSHTKSNSKSSKNNSRTKVVSTLEYHVDVIGLAAFRTRVNAESTGWDRQKYPTAPPAENVLCAFGSFQGRERLTFWAVSTLLTTTTTHNAADSSSNQQQQQQQRASNSMPNDDIGFALHVVLSEAIDVGPLGPDISIFATRNILQHWRKPRHVRLRKSTSTTTETNTNPITNDSMTTLQPAQQEDDARRKNPVATISVSMPIVSLGVSVSSHAALLAALDCNGGVTILDCALLERTASQSLSEQEYAMLYQQQQQKPTTTTEDDDDEEEEENVPTALVSTIWERSHLAKTLTIAERRHDKLSVGGKKRLLLLPPCIVDIQYLSPRLSCAMAGAGGSGTGNKAGPVLAVLTEKRLHLLTPTDVNAGKSHLSIAVVSSSSSSQLHGTAAMHILLREGLILVVKQRQEGQQKQRLLNVWNVQQLDPSDIVQALVHEEKFQEAVDSAMKLGQADQARLAGTIQTCRKRLWEAHRNDLNCLVAMTDDVYIVEQAMAISAGQVEIMRNMSRTTGKQEIDFCRSTLLLALERLSYIRLGPAIVMAGLEGTGAIQSQVRDRFIKLGTYEILCHLMDIEPSVRHFGDYFLGASMVELALCFARAADIAGLSVIYFRHHREVLASDVLVVDEIPAIVPPSEYQHLLPIASTVHDGALFLSGGDEVFCEWSLMPQYLEHHFGLTVSINEEDTKIVVEGTALDALDNVIQEVLPEFYLKRARTIQGFSCSLEHAIVFSILALAALGSSCSPSTTGYFRGVIDRAQALKKILLQSGTDVAPPALITLRLEDLERMEIIRLIAMIIDGQSDSVEVFSRFRCYIQPLLPHVAGGLDDAAVGNAISSYCSELLQDNLVSTRNTDQAKRFLRALDVCSAIVSLSRASMPVQSRLIKNRAALLELVLFIFSQVSNNVGRLALSPTQRRHALDSLWAMYESLPLQLPKSEKEEPKLVGPMKRVNEMFGLLVAADILSGWPGCVDSFDFVKGRLNDSDRSIETMDLTDAVVDLCHSFCKQVCVTERLSEVYECSELFSSLMSDIGELNRVSRGNLPVDALLADKLFEPLLRQRQIGLLAELFSSSHGLSINKELASKAILSYINDVVFSEGAHEDIQTAIACGDRLGRYFPELQLHLAETRSFVDAAHFLNYVLLPHSVTPICPHNIRMQHPIDIVESVLDQSPDSITRDCEQWADEYFAIEANKSIRHYHRTHAQKPDQETFPHELTSLPTLPACAVYHLAALLGLRDGAAVVAVKSRVIHHAVSAGFFGAAAAICRTLLLDEFTSYCEAQQIAVLDSVARVVTQPSYGDIQTKKELCSLVLFKFRGWTSTENSEAFDQILAAFCCNECILPEEDETVIPISSVDRLCQDTMREYSIDLRGLFSELHRQTAGGFIDDSLLKALSRHSLFWSIADSTKPKDYLPTLFEQDDSFVVRSLGSTILMHIQNRDMAEACLHEIQSILSEQGANAERFVSNDNEFMPRADIVRQLVGRGYSEFGARRSVWMSGNRGFDQALQWAIRHSHEQDFDYPMVLVKRKGSHVDMIGVRRLEATLELSGRLLKGQLDPSVLSIPQNSGSAAPSIANPHPTQTRIVKSLREQTAVKETNALIIKPTPQASITNHNGSRTVSAPKASNNSISIEPISNGKEKTVEVASLAVDGRSQVPPSNGDFVPIDTKLVAPTRSPPKLMPGASPTPRHPAPQLVGKSLKPLLAVPAAPSPVSQTDTKLLVDFSPAQRTASHSDKPGTSADGKHRISKIVPPTSQLHSSARNTPTAAESLLGVPHTANHNSSEGIPTENKLASAGRALFTSLKTQTAGKAHINQTSATTSGVVSNSPPALSSKPYQVANLDKELAKPIISASSGSKATTTGTGTTTSPDRQRLAETRARAKALGAKPRHAASSAAKPITRPRLDLSNVIKAKNSTTPEIGLLAGRKASSPPDPAPPPSADRLSLREQGKAALDAARNICSPEGDERRRLIEEGRRLLLKARHGPDASLPVKSLDQKFAKQPATSPVSSPPPPPHHPQQQQQQQTLPPSFSSPKQQQTPPPPPPPPKQQPQRPVPPPPPPAQKPVPQPSRIPQPSHSSPRIPQPSRSSRIPQPSHSSRTTPPPMDPIGASIPPLAPVKLTDETLEDDNMENDGWDFDEEKEKEVEITALPDITPATTILTAAIASSTTAAAPPLVSSTPNGDNNNNNNDDDSNVAEDDAGWDFEDEEEEELTEGIDSDKNVEPETPPTVSVLPQQTPATVVVRVVPSSMIPAPAPPRTSLASPALLAPTLSSNTVPDTAVNEEEDMDISVDGQDDADNNNGWDFDEDAVVSAAEEYVPTEPPPKVALPGASPPPVLPTNTETNGVNDDDDDHNDNVDDGGGGWDFDEDDLGLEPPAAAAAAAKDEPKNNRGVTCGCDAVNNEYEQEQEQEDSGGGGWDFDDI